MSDKYLVLDPQGIRELLSGPNGDVYNDMRRRGNKVMNTARRLCPVDTGGLKMSINLEMATVNGQIIVRVGTNKDYALFIHEGTANKGSGFIYPKNATVLRFPIINKSGSGRRRYKAGATAQYAYAKRVRGIKPTPFLRDALASGTN